MASAVIPEKMFGCYLNDVFLTEALEEKAASDPLFYLRYEAPAPDGQAAEIRMKTAGGIFHSVFQFAKQCSEDISTSCNPLFSRVVFKTEAALTTFQKAVTERIEKKEFFYTSISPAAYAHAFPGLEKLVVEAKIGQEEYGIPKLSFSFNTPEDLSKAKELIDAKIPSELRRTRSSNVYEGEAHTLSIKGSARMEFERLCNDEISSTLETHHLPKMVTTKQNTTRSDLLRVCKELAGMDERMVTGARIITKLGLQCLRLTIKSPLFLDQVYKNFCEQIERYPFQYADLSTEKSIKGSYLYIQGRALKIFKYKKSALKAFIS